MPNENVFVCTKRSEVAVLQIFKSVIHYNHRRGDKEPQNRKGEKKMNDYITYLVENTNTEKFMVVYREGIVESMVGGIIYETYEEAYKWAKAYNNGKEPLDQTRHH